ncbi:hypothetical protein BURK2_02959 [Burkholderiales bacterium]|nr:hypothetical protein BURK2_02959 [Burkholderiales bacterium]
MRDLLLENLMNLPQRFGFDGSLRGAALGAAAFARPLHGVQAERRAPGGKNSPREWFQK